MKFKKIYLLLTLLLFFTPVKSENKYTFYGGTFDTIDKEGDDKANLYGLEHNNPLLFKDTFIGRFSPITGGFITDKDSIYLYTGVQIQYKVGPLNIIPSLAPGYYEKGNGKDLGMALEFQSKIKLSLDVFQDYKIGYSYSHISNNDWGTKNPGVNNKIISFSKTF
ncbi:acyloxyacyl hydrolase [Candidatus Pelagibacter sp.]|nr:acyloxyacyl hydrolase [Candidatus Pelagibacter sp.]